MAYTQVCRFLDNEDSSLIAYKTFNDNENDLYPTFSICLSSPPGYSLHYFFRNEIKTEFGIPALQFSQLLKGVDIGNDSARNKILLGYSLSNSKLSKSSMTYVILSSIPVYDISVYNLHMYF